MNLIRFRGQKFRRFRYKFKIQQTSSDTYLEANKLQSQLISDSNIMENSINLDLYSNDLTVSLNSTVYEDLDKKIMTDTNIFFQKYQ